ncbi:MAG: low specificity L-threonine aldolase, partial [Pseudomonadota bacterium]
FISAQMDAYLTDGLWLRLAGHSNAMADRLADGINAVPGARVTNSIGANMLFPEITLGQHKCLQDAGAVYYTVSEFDPDGADDQIIRIRLVASFRTTKEDVDGFLAALRAA